jgi:radical SAM superfamily enzyme YgiQ (UPF0313 family)
MAAKTKARLEGRLAEERGAVRKSWADQLKIALCFPAPYRVAMANLGFQTVYAILNEEPDVLCERAVFPEPEELDRLRRTGAPLTTLESERPLLDFEVVAFSVPFEANLVQVVGMLELAKIPLKAANRAKAAGPEAPMVMAGGIAITLNPEPIADYLDLAAIGEAEAILPELIVRLRAAKSRKESRRKWLLHLADASGIYVPSLYRVSYGEDGTIRERQSLHQAPEVIRRAAPKSLSGVSTRSRLFATGVEFEDLALLEISRGCGRGCRFCAEGFLLRPPRHRPLKELASDISDLRQERDKLGLIAPTLSDFPELLPLLDEINRQGAKLSVSSLRLDQLDERLLAALSASGHRTITLAPEAGSERLRRAINKPISDQSILTAAHQIGKARIPEVKLYFLIGLPTETPADAAEIPVLVRKIQAALALGAGKKNFPGAIGLSVNPFVPKPWTPFQWHPLEGAPALEEKLRVIRGELRQDRQITISGESPRQAQVQALIARGDRRVGEVIVQGWQSGGNWARVLRETELPLDFYTTRPRFADEILPWDFVDPGVLKSYLLEEYHRAHAGQVTPICNPRKCRVCGACSAQ